MYHAGCGSPSVLYVVYWGLHEFLGQSLVLPAVRGLAEKGVGVTLVTFEKQQDLARPADTDQLRRGLAALGVRWLPLRYHKRPTIPATAFDVLQGLRTALGCAGHRRPDVIHARTFVGGLIGLALKHALRVPLVYHGEGFWSDQQVEGGFWRADSWVYRACHSLERLMCNQADGLILLSRLSRPIVESLRGVRRRRTPIIIVPSCVDLAHFGGPGPRPPADRVRLIYVGSLGGRYIIEPLGHFLNAVRRQGRQADLTVLSQSDPGLIRRGMAATGAPAETWSVARAPHREVPGRLSRAHAGMFFLRGGPGAESCSPTKIGEYWASGLPVVTTPGAGDTDAIIRQHGVGVIIRDLTPAGYERAAFELLAMLDDPGLPARCRRAAEEHYSLARGVDAQVELYRAILKRPRLGGQEEGRGTPGACERPRGSGQP